MQCTADVDTGRGPEIAEATSASWGGRAPDVAVAISSYQRAGMLRELVVALEGQEFQESRFEVVIVDNGSTDETWELLQALAEETSLRLKVVRVATNLGPGGGRNVAIAHCRAAVVAFTDDDCLPTPGWLGALQQAFADPDVAAVQGATRPHPADLRGAGPWAHTIRVTTATPLFETANVAYRRARLAQVGGFVERDPLFDADRLGPFGEDAELGARVLASGGRHVFVPEAVVHHRVLPASWRDWLREQRRGGGFAGLARRSPLVADWLRLGIFLSPTSAAFSAGVTAVVVAVATGQWTLLAAVFPWAWLRGRLAWRRTQRDPITTAIRLLQFGVGDLVLFLSLLEGSIRHRRLVL